MFEKSFLWANPLEITTWILSSIEIALPKSPPTPIPSPIFVDFKAYPKKVPIGIYLNIFIPLHVNLPSYLIPSNPETAKENA